MNLRTELDVKPASWSLEIGDQVLTLGSCFAQSMGDRFSANKFKAMTNPFGTTYHPFAIHRLLAYTAYQERPSHHTYLTHDGISYNQDFHSSNSAPDQAQLERKLSDSIGVVHHFLKDCDALIITYGTAWLFERRDTGEPVANCHRMPADTFSRRLVTVDEIMGSFREINKAIRAAHPGLRIILTISPVRHVKDTLPLNAVSKAALRLACHQLAEEFDHVSYFPAYEIMIDDLRDYRFYANDLLHPSTLAETYIWDKFAEMYFSEETKGFIKEWAGIQQALSHRAFHPESDGHQAFLANTLRQLEGLHGKVNVDEEVKQLRASLIRQPAGK